MPSEQLAFTSVLQDSFRERAIDRYLTRYRAQYQEWSAEITPAHGDQATIRGRVMFAILSANTNFALALRAWQYAMSVPRVDADLLVTYGMVPAKAAWCNAVGTGETLTKRAEETDHTHRVRLQRTVKGLGLTKASFAVGLLSPTTADVACIDTHMQHVYLGRTKFHALRLPEYLTVEAEVRKVAQRHDVGTFVAQWAIWDHARGHPEPHAFLAGAHKDTAWASW